MKTLVLVLASTLPGVASADLSAPPGADRNRKGRSHRDDG